MWQIIYIFCIWICVLPSHALPSRSCHNNDLEKQLGKFDARLYSELVKGNPDNNTIISPFSIQTCIAMARMGASSNTASEIDIILTSSLQNPNYLAGYFNNILNKYQNKPILTVANKMYINHNKTVRKDFNELLTKQFLSSVEEIDFGNNEAAAMAINGWVRNKTHNLIQDVVSKDSLHNDTSLVLVNAIHFKGEWLYKFSEEDTKEMDFHAAKGMLQIPVMYNKANFSYANFQKLRFKVLEMPYNDSDLSMLIILPYNDVALADLERELQNVSLSDLTSNMKVFDEIAVFLPKFKAEFEIDLVDTLETMGIKCMFSGCAQFNKILMDDAHLQVSSIIHKAVIEVNEKGAEAAAVTDMEISDRMGVIEFNANRPFHYIIWDKKTKFFEGNFKG